LYFCNYKLALGFAVSNKILFLTGCGENLRLQNITWAWYISRKEHCFGPPSTRTLLVNFQSIFVVIRCLCRHERYRSLEKFEDTRIFSRLARYGLSTE